MLSKDSDTRTQGMQGMAGFDGARVLITGGMGFLGSTLALDLIAQGASVLLVDAMLPGYGGNFFNIAPIRDHPRLTINFCDIRDANAMNYLVQGQDFIFHLAGQSIISSASPTPSPISTSTSRGRRC